MKSYISCLCLIALAYSATAADDWQLRGRVIDNSGQPVPAATVDHLWRANGTQRRPDGSLFDLTKDEDVKALWSREGQMEPLDGTQTGPDGSFVLSVNYRRHAVMVFDAQRQRGALTIVSSGQEAQPVELRLVPLVKVRGRFDLTGNKKPAWTIAHASIPPQATRPLDNLWITQCGSFESRFEFLLPPGRYTLEASGESNDTSANDIGLETDFPFEVTGAKPELDLGSLTMAAKTATPRQLRIAEADAANRWGDYTKHYGQPPPKWHVIDARGVKKDVQLADFRGKWVLIDFWAFGCPSCLAHDLPQLMKLYTDHAAHRDQFEFLAFCIDGDNDLKTMADVDRLLAPIVKHAWHGQTLPFPILLDPTFTTARQFGFRAYGQMLLIDPQGNLVEGDDKTLVAQLKKLE